ncbi:MAG TPA: uroporphyrinogen decarboxylase family protein, partial [Sumerlaeia bacterium]|nr:uroporphyrinogen decarboxylase family protein [Sumerlaeia bacterium]
IHDWVGSDKHLGVGGFVKEIRTNTSYESERIGNERREVMRTPVGALERISGFDEGSQSWHPTQMPVRRLDDIHVLTDWYEDLRVELEPGALERARERVAEIGDSGVVADGIGISPLMDWVQHLAGVENAHLFLAERREDVEALFDAMHGVLCDKAEIICAHTPADLTYMVENTSTTLISPDQYRTYCLKHIGDYAGIARAQGKRMALHMCGHLKLILRDIATLGVSAFEAFTSAPVGNTTLLDGRTDCPDVCLIGGTNAALWLRPAEEIIAALERDLDALPHHRGIVPTSAGVMPPLAKPETIRQVCEWVKAYPVRV